MNNFENFEIKEEIKRALLEMDFIEPTPIQSEVIPVMLKGHDVMAQAPTGTGKTCAFGIPMINNIIMDEKSVQAIVMCPTRELVIQTTEELKSVAANLGDIKILAIYGGEHIERQLSGLRRKPQIIVGTPGRVMDHLRRRTLKIDAVKLLVLDEADIMLDMGFKEDLDVILDSCTKGSERQTVMFSATMPKEILAISKTYQKNPISLKTTHNNSQIPQIEQFFLKVKDTEKYSALTGLLRENNVKLGLIFCRTKKRVEQLAMHLIEDGYKAEGLHGDLRQNQRDRIMKRFRSGDIEILVASDVAARGIDVSEIEAIFNFDVPYDEEYYVHRIGRTGRAGLKGKAFTFVTDKEVRIIKTFEEYTKTKITKITSDVAVSTTSNTDMILRAIKETTGNDNSKVAELINVTLNEYNASATKAITIEELAAQLFVSLSDSYSISSDFSEKGLPSSTERKIRKIERAEEGGSSSSSRPRQGRRPSNGGDRVRTPRTSDSGDRARAPRADGDRARAPRADGDRVSRYSEGSDRAPRAPRESSDGDRVRAPRAPRSSGDGDNFRSRDGFERSRPVRNNETSSDAQSTDMVLDTKRNKPVKFNDNQGYQDRNRSGDSAGFKKDNSSFKPRADRAFKSKDDSNSAPRAYNTNKGVSAEGAKPYARRDSKPLSFTERLNSSSSSDRIKMYVEEDADYGNKSTPKNDSMVAFKDKRSSPSFQKFGKKKDNN